MRKARVALAGTGVAALLLTATGCNHPDPAPRGPHIIHVDPKQLPRSDPRHWVSRATAPVVHQQDPHLPAVVGPDAQGNATYDHGKFVAVASAPAPDAITEQDARQVMAYEFSQDLQVPTPPTTPVVHLVDFSGAPVPTTKAWVFTFPPFTIGRSSHWAGVLKAGAASGKIQLVFVVDAYGKSSLAAIPILVG